MQPKLYNWVRAIRNISLISSIYTTLVLLAATGAFFAIRTSEQGPSFPYSLLIALAASLLLTIFVRKFLLQKLVSKFNTTFSFELLLAFWCILLILIHLQCQLMFLMLFRTPVETVIAIIVFIFGASIIYLTWPRLKNIQSLIKGKEL